ncbi:hypothetical protein KBY83_00360 [Cyanobium sp. WKJ7-Wakatipu]|uniref:hypothetical protein n=1 Tax=Cyanobium sp. WKJ7-Wakatipu TaxID=2823726 RepID=UPI0020CD2A6A|nr:hypothetical protein [Cyanobium sp. WKJ7-Wakatipu]MCP9781768.1 hypothetical protein [Cyanobium sp. WKJ7-Wakatipu]MCX5927283.1 hypothetical protein [Cyanobium sp. LacPavin_0920_WC12_MAG_63_22]
MATPELVNSNLQQLVAAAADLCRKPWRHAVLPLDDAQRCDDCNLRLEVRKADGERYPAADLEIEIYRSGDDLNLTLAWCHDEQRPLLWQGSHPVWMEPESGLRCERPVDGAPLEALARRLRALLVPLD